MPPHVQISINYIYICFVFRPINRFDASDSEDDEDREVKSKKDKLVDQLAEIVIRIKNKVKIADWEQVETAYADLNKMVKKNKKDLLTEDSCPPRVYLKCVVELEGIVGDAWKAKKSLSKLRSRSVGNLKRGIPRTNKVRIPFISRKTPGCCCLQV